MWAVQHRNHKTSRKVSEKERVWHVNACGTQSPTQMQGLGSRGLCGPHHYVGQRMRRRSSQAFRENGKVWYLNKDCKHGMTWKWFRIVLRYNRQLCADSRGFFSFHAGYLLGHIPSQSSWQWFHSQFHSHLRWNPWGSGSDSEDWRHQ